VSGLYSAFVTEDILGSRSASQGTGTPSVELPNTPLWGRVMEVRPGKQLSRQSGCVINADIRFPMNRSGQTDAPIVSQSTDNTVDDAHNWIRFGTLGTLRVKRGHALACFETPLFSSTTPTATSGMRPRPTVGDRGPDSRHSHVVCWFWYSQFEMIIDHRSS